MSLFQTLLPLSPHNSLESVQNQRNEKPGYLSEAIVIPSSARWLTTGPMPQLNVWKWVCYKEFPIINYNLDVYEILPVCYCGCVHQVLLWWVLRILKRVSSYNRTWSFCRTVPSPSGLASTRLMKVCMAFFTCLLHGSLTFWLHIAFHWVFSKTLYHVNNLYTQIYAYKCRICWQETKI